MKMHDRRADTGLRDRWMVSYIDVLTILLIFFVALAAKSLPSPKTITASALPATVARKHTQLQAAQRDLENAPALHHLLDLNMEKRGLVISLPQTILFRPGRDQVDVAALPIVESIARVLQNIPNKISLIGHTDPLPIHNRRFRNNWELAAARGLRLLDLLTARYGIADSRLSTTSYGSTSPRSSNDTADGRANNRRVEILILDADP